MTHNIICQLFDIGSIKFGDFTLKSGVHSSYYIDLRMIISYPSLLEQISELMYQKIKNIEFDLLCGVPYTALPIATSISLNHNIPMVMKRKEKKTYGTKKIIEGVYKLGDKCIIVEDVITSGASIIETVLELNKVGIQVTDAIVLINREQDGIKNLQKYDINVHSCINVSDILNFRKKSYNQRAEISSNPISMKLFNIMNDKKTNLCISIDLTKTKDIIKIIKNCGEHICMIKLHIDIIEDFSVKFIKTIQQLSKDYNFMIFEDRKFADIGNTVKHQFTDGIYNIMNWAEIINCHILPGPSIIESLKKVSIGNGLLLIAQMSSKDNLITSEYTKKCIEYANKYKDFVMGFICTGSITTNPEFIHMTPGVNINVKGDKLGQQYKTPEEVIYENGSDIIIVGRGIYSAENPEKMAKEYKEKGWNAYLKLINKN